VVYGYFWGCLITAPSFFGVSLRFPVAAEAKAHGAEPPRGEAPSTHSMIAFYNIIDICALQGCGYCECIAFVYFVRRVYAFFLTYM
jgi:hypothetical protein